jgi:hypothetical protein
MMRIPDCNIAFTVANEQLATGEAGTWSAPLAVSSTGPQSASSSVRWNLFSDRSMAPSAVQPN